MKNLLWRACRNALPTKANLVRRTIITDPVCARCLDAHETPLHALWMCKELDSVWDSSVSWNFRCRVHFLDFKELLSWIIMQQQHTELFAWMAWKIWSQRNKVRLNQPTCSTHQIAQLSNNRLSEFLAAQVPHPHLQSQPKPKWRLPPENYVKINFDGAVFSGARKSGIGVVIRNNRGLVIASCSQVLHEEFNSNEIEALAAAKALSFAAE